MRSTGNAMLDEMSPTLFSSVMNASQPYTLAQGTVLFRAGAEPRKLVFLTAGIACTTVILKDGTTTRVALTGPEGIVGYQALLSSDPMTVSCVMQTLGTGIATSRKHLQHLFLTSEEFRAQIMPYARSQADVAIHTAACAIRHQAEARLVRWLLEASDRLGQDGITVTQEYLSHVVGICRTTVATLAGELQRDNLIRYSRGTVQLCDRDGLEAKACECYALCRATTFPRRESPPPDLPHAA